MNTIEHIVAINARSAAKAFGGAQFKTGSWVTETQGYRWVAADADNAGHFYSQCFHVPDHITLPLPEIGSLYRAEIERLQATSPL